MKNDNNKNTTNTENSKEKKSENLKTPVSKKSPGNIKKTANKKTLKKKITSKQSNVSLKDVNSSLSLSPSSQEKLRARKVDFPAELQGVLKKRALHLAEIDKNISDTSLLHDFIICLMGDREKYGIEQSYIDEVLYLSDITPVPCTPDFIAGVVNRRSQILPVLDVRQFFSIEKTEFNDDARIVVLKNKDMLTGIIVNAIIDTDSFNPTEIEPALPSDGLTNKDYVQGIYQGDITLLDINNLLTDEKILVNNKLQTA